VAPHSALPPIVLERMVAFSGATHVKHDTLVAATVALESGATHEMLDMVLSLSRGKRPQNANEVRAMLETAGVAVADNVLRTLLTFSQAVNPNGNKETIKSIVIGISEARRDEFYVRNAALPKIQTKTTGRRERKHA